MKESVDLGRGAYVRRSLVVGVHDGFPSDSDLEKMVVTPWNENDVKSVVILADGKLMPACFKASTVIKRLEAADGEAE